MEALFLNSRSKGNIKGAKEKKKKEILLLGESNCYFGTETKDCKTLMTDGKKLSA